MLGQKPYYNRTIRKLVVAFGTLFNDIQLVRFTKDGLTEKENFKVPLMYGPKEKYITRLQSDPTLTKSILTNVPRISFQLESLEYDANRKQLTTIQNFAYIDGKVKSQYMPIPYNFEFSMSIFVRNIEDGTQIVEQILPFFTPDFTLTIDFNPGMNQKYDIPIILNSVNTSIDYEGDMSTTRLIIWDLMFTVKGFLWPGIKGDSSLIGLNSTANTGGAFVHTWDYDQIGLSIANSEYFMVRVTPDPLNAQPNTAYGFTTEITEYDNANDVYKI